METTVLDHADGVLDRVGNRDAHQIDRHHQDKDGDQYDQRRNAPFLLPQRPLQPLLQWVKGDRQDQRPQHQVAERAEDLEAEQHQNGDQPGPDKHIEQRARQLCFG
ncbi:hypothetical protein D9M70_553910 [compost metagenome]